MRFGAIIARSYSTWQPVHAEAPSTLAGQVLPCEVVSIHPNSLAVRILDGKRSGDPPEQEKAAA